jgi:hypothetical protein
MIASVGSWITGSGTSSTRTSRLACQVTAFIGTAFQSGSGVPRLTAGTTTETDTEPRPPTLRW